MKTHPALTAEDIGDGLPGVRRDRGTVRPNATTPRYCQTIGYSEAVWAGYRVQFALDSPDDDEAVPEGRS